MAGSEWGPKDVPKEKHKLIEITRFYGTRLDVIAREVIGYLKTHPGSTRDEAIDSLALNAKEANRMQIGLDVLNQLSVLERSAVDVRSIIVRQDLNNTIQDGANQGQHHLWYEIDWIREPDQKPEPKPIQHTPKNKQLQAPAKARVAWRTGSIREARRRRRETLQLEKEGRQERKAVDDVVIDRGKEVGQNSINAKVVKIELDHEGTAVISYRNYGFGDYHRINRETGVCHPYGDDENAFFAEVIDSKYLRYYEFLARIAEGKEASYSPEPLSPETCEDIYNRALKAQMITLRPDGVFGYMVHGNIFISYGEMDLENNVVVGYDFLGMNKRERPIHPDFADFLRKQNAALE